MKLIECRQCLGRFRMNEHGALARALDDASRAGKPDAAFICPDCDTDRPLNETKERTIDGYLSTKSSRNLRGMGR